MRFAFLLGFVAASVCVPQAVRAAEFGSHSIVSTIAGDGQIGMASGEALQAHFVLPVGVSIGVDGSTLVTDAGANAIYRLRSGSIKRVAGVIAHIDAVAGAAGGYVDGPISSASFDRPSAAIEVNGRGIFVADSGNHCIRLITGGQVRTYAGSRSTGASDGTLQAATFTNPDGLALAPDGALLVADFGNGIRRIAPDGRVTTLSYGSKTILGIAAQNVNGHDIVAYTDREAIHLILDGNDQTIAADQDRMPTKDGLPVFGGWGIAILNENTVVVSDAITGVIRMIRFPARPYVGQIGSIALSGTIREDTDFHGGFRDGNASDALYHAPRGIALDPRGRLVIADSGNRRIRLLDGIDARETVLPDVSNFTQDPGARNIVMIGQSQLLNGTLWSDSVPAAAEDTFARAAGADGIGKRVRIQAFRADAAPVDAMFDIADNYVSDRSSIDAIAFFFTLSALSSVDDVVVEANRLAKQNIKTIVYLLPERSSVALGEYSYNDCGCIVDAQDIRGDNATLARLLTQFRAAGIQADTFVPAIAKAESQKNPTPLYDAADPHFTPAGQRLLGRSFALSLLADRRWLAAKAPVFPDVFAKVNACPMLTVDPNSPNIGALDTLTSGDVRPSEAKKIADGDKLTQSDVVNFRGWAFLAAQALPERRVCPVVDGVTGFSVRGNEAYQRPDVAKVFHLESAENSGFSLQFDLGALTRGPHRMGIAAILSDGKAYPIGASVDIVVQ